MKIALLTSAFSGLFTHRESCLKSDGNIVVDFSDGYEIAAFCRNADIAHITFASWEQLAEELTDCMLIVSYKLNKIIPMDFVARFRYGGVNIHPSLLPKYPGPNPWFQMYFNMELDAGVTIHRIVAKPDAGNILAQRAFRLRPCMPLPEAMAMADAAAAELLDTVLAKCLFLAPGTEQPSCDGNAPEEMNLQSIKQLPPHRRQHIFSGFPDLLPLLYPDSEYIAAP